MKKQRNKIKQSDITNITNSYIKKIEEFNKLSLDELKELYQTQKIGGIYKKALFDVVNTKLQAVKEESIKDKIETIKEIDNEKLLEDDK